jgi:zinc/manganese transport system permease protein
VAVAEASQITGSLLVFALLVMPAAAAQRFTARPVAGLALSVVIALIVTWLGLVVAYYTPYPMGFYITTFAFAVYLASFAVRYLLDRHGAMPALTLRPRMGPRVRT